MARTTDGAQKLLRLIEARGQEAEELSIPLKMYATLPTLPFAACQCNAALLLACTISPGSHKVSRGRLYVMCFMTLGVRESMPSFKVGPSTLCEQAGRCTGRGPWEAWDKRRPVQWRRQLGLEGWLRTLFANILHKGKKSPRGVC